MWGESGIGKEYLVKGARGGGVQRLGRAPH